MGIPGYQDILATLQRSPVIVETPIEDNPPPEPPRDVRIVEMPAALAKGIPVWLFKGGRSNKLSDEYVEMKNWNAAHIEVFVTGTSSPSANISAMGSGSDGNYTTLPDPAAVQTGVNANTSFDVYCGAERLKVDISNIAGSFTNDQGFSIRVTPYTGGFVVSPNMYRGAGVLHRNAITTADKVSDMANTDITTADNGVGTGSLTNGTTYYATIIPYNRWGACKVAGTINQQVTGGGAATHSIRLTFSQVTGADGYDIFLSTDTAPKWVARVTEAQRAAGDFEVTAVGTVASGGGNPAGTIDVNVAGTGIQTSNGVFAQSNAFRPDNTSITAINCAGRQRAHIKTKLALTDLRSAPTLNIIVFFGNQLSSADWHAGQLQVLDCLAALGAPLERELVLDLDGEPAMKVLISSISGQGAAFSCWVELS